MRSTTRFNNKRLLFLLACLVGLGQIFPAEADAQKRRDHLTAEEIEIVRDVQEIDYRMIVFVKAVERRFIVLEGGLERLDEKSRKKIAKEEEVWGSLPEGSRTDMISDIDRIIDEAISKIEDVAERDAESERFPIAVHILSDSCRSFVPRLEPYGGADANARETALINSTLRKCSDIAEASAKVPRPSEKEMKKRTKRL